MLRNSHHLEWRVLNILLLFTMVITSLYIPSSATNAATSNPQTDIPLTMTWQLQMDVPIPADQVQSMGGEKKAQTDLTSLLGDRLSTHGVNTQVQLGEVNADGVTFQVTVDGTSSQQDLRQVLYADLGKGLDFLGGPIQMDITSDLVNGEVFDIILESRPATGYAWQVDENNPGLVTQVGAIDTMTRGEGLGVPSTATLHLQSQVSGLATLNLHYSRSFGPPAAPTRSLHIQASTLSAGLDLSNPNPQIPQLPPLQVQHPSVTADSVDAEALPSSFDWRSQGVVPPIRDQGSCGSCWAFGTVGVLESALMIKGFSQTDVSEQFLVSCNNDGYGCDGGWWSAHDYHTNRLGKLQSTIGAVRETDMPYTATNGSCKVVSSHPYRQASWAYVAGNWSITPTTAQIKQAIYDHGPVGASVCAGPAFDNYRSGVFSTDEAKTCNGGTNHAIVLVGWDDAQDAWILRNSWNTWWGNNGYMLIKRGVSNVGSSANYVVYDDTPVVVTCYSLTTQVNNGKVTVNPTPNCTDGKKYIAGTKVKLTATADYGYNFTGWSGSTNSVSNPVEYIVNDNSSITANMSYTTPPSNDAFGSRKVIAANGGVTSYADTADSSNATNEANDPAFPYSSGAKPGYRTLWYEFTPISGGVVSIDTYNSTFDTVLGVWTATTGGVLNTRPVTWNDNTSTRKQSRVSFSVRGGVTYYIQAASKYTNAGIINLHFKFTPSSTSNNSISYARTIPYSASGVTYQFLEDVWSATTSSYDPKYSGNAHYRTVWFRFKPISSGQLNIDTQANYTPIIGVYYGPSTALNTVAQSTPGGSLQNVMLVGGVTYYIEVASQEANGPSRLDFHLSFTPVVATPAGQFDLPSNNLIQIGNWSTGPQPGAVGDNLLLSSKTYSIAAVTFSGTRLHLFFSRLPGQGTLKILVDGSTVSIFSQNSSTLKQQAEWKSRLLPVGIHTVTFLHYGGASTNLDAITIDP